MTQTENNNEIFFETGDIVEVIASETETNKYWENAAAMKGLNGSIVTTFKERGGRPAALVNFDGFAVPLLTGNLKLLGKAPAKPVTMKAIPADIYRQLRRLGILDTSVRSYNVGESDYSQHIIQPWSIILEYRLNYWDGDIIKRVLRHKLTDPRRLDYEKIIQICEERIRQIEAEEEE